MNAELFFLIGMFGTPVLFLFVGLIYYLFFSTKVSQRIEKNGDEHFAVITEVYYYDKKIKTFTTVCHYNDGAFDDKAKKDLELAKIYLDRYITYYSK
jgi:hypothetical protein